MRIPHTPPERHTWFSTAPPDAPAPLLTWPVGDTAGGTFARLWAGFMSARVLIGLAMLGLFLAQSSAGRAPVWVLALCLVYLAATALGRLLMQPCRLERPIDPSWLYTVGVDLVFILALQFLYDISIDYTPLLVLPVLMASVMGTRQLALGTAALTTLALLCDAGLDASAASWRGTTGIVQAGLAGAGLLALSLLTSQLSIRLAREEALVRRSRSETRMQSLVNNLVIEALPDGVLVVDSAYTVRAANPAAHLMLGVDPEETPTPFSLLDHPAWVQLVHVVRLTLADGPADEVDITLHYEDRHSSHLRARTERTPPAGDGAGSLCVLFLQDLREMEARLRTDKLVAMGRMSAAVAHEIRNPLAAISQANALLEEDLTAPAQQRLTAMVRQNAERLGHIVEDVLDVVRVQETSDARELHTLPLDDEVESFYSEWLEQHQAGARLRIELRAPETQAQFAREHLRRVLVNLLDNAARYASGKPGAIQVSTQVVRHGPATLMVWSDGAPLEEAVRRHLFEPFSSSEARSSGLGLFICRELCERHGAVIGYERTARHRDGAAVEGNEFFVHFRRTHSVHSVLLEEASQL